MDYQGPVALQVPATVATALLDGVDHVRQPAGTLRELLARPLEEVELLHLPALFPLGEGVWLGRFLQGTVEVKLKKLIFHGMADVSPTIYIYIYIYIYINIDIHIYI